MACAQVMSDKDLARFRTKLCQRHLSGICEFNARCQYSHSKSRHQRRCPFLLLNKEPLAVLRYIPVFCEDVKCFNVENERLETGALTFQHLDETSQCPRGAGCPFAHSEEEVLYHPLMYKQKTCPKYKQMTSEGETSITPSSHTSHCISGCTEYYCPYVHDLREKRQISNLTYFLAPSFAKRISLYVPQPILRIPISKINTSKLSDFSFKEAPWLKRLMLTDPDRETISVSTTTTPSAENYCQSVLFWTPNVFSSETSLENPELLQLSAVEIRKGSVLLAAASLTENDVDIMRKTLSDVWKTDLQHTSQNVTQINCNPYDEHAQGIVTSCPTLLERSCSCCSEDQRKLIGNCPPILYVSPGDVLYVQKLLPDPDDMMPNVLPNTYEEEGFCDTKLTWNYFNSNTSLNRTSFWERETSQQPCCKNSFAYARCVAGKGKNKEGWFPLSLCLGVDKKCYFHRLPAGETDSASILGKPAVPKNMAALNHKAYDSSTTGMSNTIYLSGSCEIKNCSTVPRNANADIPSLPQNSCTPGLSCRRVTDASAISFLLPSHETPNQPKESVLKSNPDVEAMPIMSNSLVDTTTPTIVRPSGTVPRKMSSSSVQQNWMPFLSSAARLWQKQLRDIQEYLQNCLIEELVAVVTHTASSTEEATREDDGDAPPAVLRLCERLMIKGSASNILRVISQLETVSTMNSYGVNGSEQGMPTTTPFGKIDPTANISCSLEYNEASSKPTDEPPGTPRANTWRSPLNMVYNKHLDSGMGGPAFSCSKDQRQRVNPSAVLDQRQADGDRFKFEPYSTSSARICADLNAEIGARQSTTGGATLLESTKKDSADCLFKPFDPFATPLRGDTTAGQKKSGNVQDVNNLLYMLGALEPENSAVKPARHSLASASTADYLDLTGDRGFCGKTNGPRTSPIAAAPYSTQQPTHSAAH